MKKKQNYSSYFLTKPNAIYEKNPNPFVVRIKLALQLISSQTGDKFVLREGMSEEEEFAGRLFIWGKCSRNEKEASLSKPTSVPYFFNRKVVQVACGLGFTGILTGKKLRANFF